MKILSAFALAFLLIGGTARLNAGFVLNFDETGACTFSDPSGASINYGGATSGSCAERSLSPDPVAGDGETNSLIFLLPEIVNNGPVGIFETNGTTLSDILVFTNSSGDVTPGHSTATEMIVFVGPKGGQ